MSATGVLRVFRYNDRVKGDRPMPLFRRSMFAGLAALAAPAIIRTLKRLGPLRRSVEPANEALTFPLASQLTLLSPRMTVTAFNDGTNLRWSIESGPDNVSIDPETGMMTFDGTLAQRRAGA